MTFLTTLLLYTPQVQKPVAAGLQGDFSVTLNMRPVPAPRHLGTFHHESAGAGLVAPQMLKYASAERHSISKQLPAHAHPMPTLRSIRPPITTR